MSHVTRWEQTAYPWCLDAPPHWISLSLFLLLWLWLTLWAWGPAPPSDDIRGLEIAAAAAAAAALELPVMGSCCEACNPGSYFQLRRGVRLGGVGHKNKETGEIMKWQEQQIRGVIGSTSFQSYSHSEGVQNMRASIVFGQTEHVYLDIFHFHWFNLSSLFLTLQ